MRSPKRVIVLAIQLIILLCISYEISRFTLQFGEKDLYALSLNDGRFYNNGLLIDSHSGLTAKSKHTYVASHMKKWENKLNLGLTESNLQDLYKMNRTTDTKKIIVNYGNIHINIIRNFTSCFTSDCELIFDRTRWREADAVLLTDHLYPKGQKPPNQLWFIFVHEPPFYVKIANGLENMVNYTISYRMDSSIYVPYHNYVPTVASHGADTKYQLPSRNYATGKSKMVAWFVSNCHSYSPRIIYAEELSRYVPVDVYGKCGNKICLRTSQENCFNLLEKHYKFYLSFENSLCSDYITEKFFGNALSHNVIPIVMGASIEEYKRVAPPHSFIHVDQFESPEKLADYLKYLDKNETAYNEYFSWHDHGNIDAWSPRPECIICLLTHIAHKLKPYTFPNVSRWWNNGCAGRKLRWNSTF
ncbi:Glycoprotein 3-alpha-L-fucosyltransferase A [Schistosoma japonicum]|uniref:Fucosyltransferase n=1 Tax=Schistosoma japonicum TaxID=6182 RepID=A0A4Z2CTY8_SCHJA|nr:Glycoprotein 3-alpha-L-fucosyltransferase A [Schistosoma japonicum]KAH8868426.1 Glycoprotein 3-alpha-L-fucosyltransferase A [Schistosoma japonicum]KAH8868427.1 Glycoprotein 3-alpha-L-fucosyltransferase A [Schistosoma japonicum]TNN07584.1 Glycoprotein 3-alpha-L-fucosyltransferase A [Schistosoma japonicum]